MIEEGNAHSDSAAIPGLPASVLKDHLLPPRGNRRAS
jgi:hypothetical protein